MQENLNDLRTFLLVAQTNSFTKVAAQLGISRAAVSYTIGQLESRLGMKLFNRTTRSVATTDAGEQLFQQIAPLFDDIDSRLSQILDSQNQKRGTLRINGTVNAIASVLWNKFQAFSKHYPEITLELAIEMRFVDIVAERFDAGIREGAHVDLGMIAVRVSGDFTQSYVASPDYLAKHGTPETPDDLVNHNCIRLRLPTHGGLLDWEFQHPTTGERFKRAVQGNFIVNNPPTALQAALDGVGISWEMTNEIEPFVKAGKLVRLLPDWECDYQGYHLYFPNRTVNSPLLKELVAWLRV